MEKANCYFLTSYPQSMLEKYSFFIDDKEQSNSFQIKKGNDSIFINKIPLEKDISIKIQSNAKINEYRIKINQQKKKKESNVFLFNYDLESRSKQIRYINWKTLIVFFWKDQKYINIDYSVHEKFLLFYQYFFHKDYSIEELNLCYELIQAYLKEIGNKEKIPIDIGISILVIYKDIDKDSKGLESYLSIWKRINKNKDFDIIDKTIFLDEINKCLDKLLTFQNRDKNIILEIIVIYYIKYRNKDLSVLLSDKYKNLFLNLFKGNLFFLDEKYLDDEISQNIIQSSPTIDNIVSILKQSKDYNDYLTKIKNSIDQIYEAIGSLKSLKGIFQVDLEVSQGEKINEFVRLHEELLQMQEEKGKYIISFFPMIKKYYSLFKTYNNLEGLCDLLTMLMLESKKFPKIIQKIKSLKSEIIRKINELLQSKLDNNEINGIDFVTILFKLREVYDDGNLFDKEFKKKIFKYFIKKCKDKDSNVIKSYKTNKIYKLFTTKNNYINICLLLSQEEFEVEDNFIDLLPDELNNNELDIILNLIEDILEKNEKDERRQSMDIFFLQLFNKKIDLYYALQKIKPKELNYPKIIEFAWGVLNIYGEIYCRDIVDYLDKNFFIKNLFSFKSDNNEKSIPIYIYEKLNDEKTKAQFKELILNKLASYVIDEETIFSEEKNYKFLLLEDLYQNNLFDYDYKTKTIECINNTFKKREEYSYEKIMKVVTCYDNNNNYYDKVKGLLTESQQLDLRDFYLNEINSDKNNINELQTIYDFLKTFFPETKSEDISNVKDFIDTLKKEKINTKENYRNELYEIKNKYNQSKKKYHNYSKSKIFMALYYKLKQNENERFLNELKTQFDDFIINIFEKDLLLLNLCDNIIYEGLQKLKESELIPEFNMLYSIYREVSNKNVPVRELIIKNKVKEIIRKIELNNQYNSKSKLINGILLLLNNLNINKNGDGKDDFYSQINDLIKEDNKEEFIKKAKSFLNNNKEIDEGNLMAEFLKSLSKCPKALEWLKNVDEKKLN